MKRWKVNITYRTDNGTLNDTVYFEELEELDTYVEAGPHWDTIIAMTISPANPTYPELTLEQAEKL